MGIIMCEYVKQRNVALDVLVTLFGIGAWLAVNGMWVELPILVEKLPEQWSLPSYMTIIIQSANIGAILYGVFHKLWPKKVNETSTIFIIMTIGTIACFLLVFFWDETVFIGNELHSLGLFILVFFIALVDCTSSVVFIPFMAVFSETYLVSYFIGEGFSGFFPSIIALGQGVGGNPSCVNMSVFNETTNEYQYEIRSVTPEPDFSVEVFFYILSAMMCTSFIAFLILRFYPWGERWLSNQNLITSLNVLTKGQSPSSSTSSYLSVSEVSFNHQSNSTPNEASLITSSSDPQNFIKNFNPKLYRLRFHLTIILWINFMLNGVLLSVQSYSCLPYGNLAYHLVVTISNAANPVACFVAFFLPNQSVGGLVTNTIISTLIGIYILVLAILSPVPPLIGTAAGESLVILAWIAITGLISHTKTSIAMLFHEKGSWALFWYGCATQIGSFIGSLIMFLLVNVYELFKSYNACA